MANPRPTKPSISSHQVLVRLPNDLAERFGNIVPARQRSRFLVELLRRELEREHDSLVEAAKRLTELESADLSATVETSEWLDSGLVEESDPFDVGEFESQFRDAQSRTNL